MVETATDITRNTVDEMRTSAEDLKTKIADLADDIQKHTGAKVLAPPGDEATAEAAPAVKPLSL